MDQRLLLPILCAQTLIYLGRYLPSWQYGWLVGLIFVGGIYWLFSPLNWVFSLRGRRRLSRHAYPGQASCRYLLCLILLVSGSAGANLWWQGKQQSMDPMVQAWLGGENQFEVIATVQQPIRTLKGGKQQIIVQVNAARFAKFSPVSTRMRLKVFTQGWPKDSLGTSISFPVRLNSAQKLVTVKGTNLRATTQFPPSALLTEQSGQAIGPRKIVANPSGWSAWSEWINQQLNKSIVKYPAAKALLPAMILGDQGELNLSTRQTLQASALIHIVCLSGMHISIILNGAQNLFSVLPVGGQKIASLLAVIGYLHLLGPSPSLLRASLMAIASFIALGLSRPQAGLHTLYLTVIALLIWDPNQVTQLGFLLSAVSTGAIIISQSPWQKYWSKRLAFWERYGLIPTRWPRLASGLMAILRPVIRLLGVSLAAQLATMPLLLLIRPGINIYGLLANLLVHPVVLPLMWGGIIYLGLELFSEFQPGVIPIEISDLLASGLNYLAGWLLAVADKISNCPGAICPWPSGLLGISLLAIVGFTIWLYGYLYRHGYTALLRERQN